MVPAPSRLRQSISPPQLASQPLRIRYACLYLLPVPLTRTVIRLLFPSFLFSSLASRYAIITQRKEYTCCTYVSCRSASTPSPLTYPFLPSSSPFFPHSTQVYSTNLTSSVIFSASSPREGALPVPQRQHRKENSQFKRLNYLSLRLPSLVSDARAFAWASRPAGVAGRDEASGGADAFIIDMYIWNRVSLSFPYLMLCDVVMEKPLAIQSPRSQMYKQRKGASSDTHIKFSCFPAVW